MLELHRLSPYRTDKKKGEIDIPDTGKCIRRPWSSTVKTTWNLIWGKHPALSVCHKERSFVLALAHWYPLATSYGYACRVHVAVIRQCFGFVCALLLTLQSPMAYTAKSWQKDCWLQWCCISGVTQAQCELSAQGGGWPLDCRADNYLQGVLFWCQNCSEVDSNPVPDVLKLHVPYSKIIYLLLGKYSPERQLKGSL